MQARREEELGHLERSVTRMGGLEKELAKEKESKAQVKVALEQKLQGLKEQLQKK